MITGPRYKIARRLGANIYEKTQTPKFALRSERKGKPPYRPRTEYGTAMLEKQKVRFTYGVGEKQFKKYVKEAVAKKGVNTVQALFERLETRLDNVVYRLGWAPTRLAARQMVTHGHIRVDNKKASVPSYIVTQKQVISVREASFKKPLFKEFDEKTKTVQVPAWLAFDHEKKAATVTGKPQWNQLENLFNLGNVIEFYSR